MKDGLHARRRKYSCMQGSAVPAQPLAGYHRNDMPASQAAEQALQRSGRRNGMDKGCRRMRQDTRRGH